MQGCGSARPRLLHQHRERQGARTERPAAGGGAFPLEIAAPPGPVPRAYLRSHRGRERRLFRLAAEREPDRRLGERSNHGRSPRAAISKRRWKLTSGSSEAATCRGRTIGAAIGSIRSRSSSGATAPPDCTSGSGLPARGPNRPGTSGSFIPESRSDAGEPDVHGRGNRGGRRGRPPPIGRQFRTDREAGCGLTRAEACVRRDGRARQLRSCGALSQAPGRA